MSESKRQHKFSRMLQQELSEIFQRDVPHLVKTSFVTVTHVLVSPDLSVAKTYLSFMLDPNKVQLLDKINEHKSEIRKHLGHRIGKQVRHIPELVFFLNDAPDHAAHMSRLIDDLQIPPAPESDEEEGSED